MARPPSDIRVRILHAARERFLKEGVDGASLRQIAKDARTSIGMVYYYFPTKDDLFLGVAEEVYEVVLADLLEALDPARPVPERIRRLYERVGRATEDEVLVIRLVVREVLASSLRREQIVERFQRGHLPALFRLVADGMADGTFRSDLHPIVIFGTMMALGGPGQLLLRFLAPRAPFGGVPEGEELSKKVLSVFLRGAGAAPAGGSDANDV